MEKMILADRTEIEMQEGSSPSAVTAVLEDWGALGDIAAVLTKEGNFDKVQFAVGTQVTGEYRDMLLESPLFHAVDIKDGKIAASFSIRKKTEMELAIEELKKGQDIQDRAIMELAGIMAGGEE